MEKGRGVSHGAADPRSSLMLLALSGYLWGGWGERCAGIKPLRFTKYLCNLFALNSEKDGFRWAGGERGLALDWAQVGFPHHCQLRGSAPGHGERLGDAHPLLFYFSPFLFPPSWTWEQRFGSQARVFAGEGLSRALALGKSLAGLHSGDVLLCVLP